VQRGDRHDHVEGLAERIGDDVALDEIDAVGDFERCARRKRNLLAVEIDARYSCDLPGKASGEGVSTRST
jgi:hypothetical protein